MKKILPLLAVCAAALAVAVAADAVASPGDVVVPAHRTRDGHYVPANVPPLSAGTHVARRPARHRTAAAGETKATLAPPLLVEAQPIRR